MLLIVLFSVPCLACTVPFDGMHMNSSASLCNDVYFLDDGIHISGEDVRLDCDGAILKGSYDGAGVSITGHNITVENCRILNYETGFIAIDASSVFLVENHLVRNFVGTSFFLVKDSLIYNYDVSLHSPLLVLSSWDNVISSMNRFFEGGFCSNNFCNSARMGVETALVPKNDEESFQKWFAGVLTEW